MNRATIGCEAVLIVDPVAFLVENIQAWLADWLKGHTTSDLQPQPGNIHESRSNPAY